MKGFLKNSNFSGRLFQLFQFLLIFCFCFLAGIILALIVSGGNMDNVSSLKMATFIQSVSTFLLPSFILAYLWSERPLDFLRLKVKPDWKAFVFVVLMMIIAIPAINLLADLNQRISFPAFMSDIEEQLKMREKQAAIQTEKMLFARTLGGLLLNIFLIAIIPALSEEFFFRATLQRIISDAKGVILAIWVAAFIFSAIHMQFYGFVPRLLLGAFFGYLLVWSGSIWLPVIAHFVNNALAVVFHYLSDKGFQVIDIDIIGTGNTWWLGLVCGIVFVCGFCFLQQYFKRGKEKLSMREH